MSEQVLSLFKPQLLILYKDKKIIERCIVLKVLNKPIDSTSKVYKFINLLKDVNPDIIIEEQIGHIFLNMSIEYVKGYVVNIFNIKERCILFSPETNIEYVSSTSLKFDPFQNQDNVSMNTENIMHFIFKDCMEGIILSIACSHNTKFSNLGNQGEYNEHINIYEKKK